MPRFVITAAFANNRIIGKDGHLPWKLSPDISRFQAMTVGKTILLGRKTYENLPITARPIPNRTNIVITTQPDFVADESVQTIRSLNELPEDEEIWVFGGAELYQLCMPQAIRLELTHIQLDISGDAFFPPIPPFEWEIAAREFHEGEPNYEFITYSRTTKKGEVTESEPIASPKEPTEVAKAAKAAV
jgi:dihydrofolate reductase